MALGPARRRHRRPEKARNGPLSLVAFQLNVYMWMGWLLVMYKILVCIKVTSFIQYITKSHVNIFDIYNLH